MALESADGANALLAVLVLLGVVLLLNPIWIPLIPSCRVLIQMGLSPLASMGFMLVGVVMIYVGLKSSFGKA